MYQWLRRLFVGEAAPEAAPEAIPSAPPLPDPVAKAPASAAPAAPSGKSPSGIAFDQVDTVDRSYYAWLFGSEDDSALDLNPAEQQVLDALEQIVRNQQSGVALVRRMPGLIPQLLQSLRSENFSGAALARTIANDLVLVAAVIRLANASMKGSGKSIDSVEHAVMVIGQEGLRHLITTVAFRPIIDINSGYYTRTLAPRIWDRCERCAAANRTLAPAVGVEPFEAFLAGLVQSVGLIVSLRIMDQTEHEQHPLGSDMFWARLIAYARTLACSIAKEWNFPEAVAQALAEQGSMAKGAVMSPLGRLVALSDYLSKVRILAEQGVVREGDPALFDGLPGNAVACYAALEKVEDEPEAGSA